MNSQPCIAVTNGPFTRNPVFRAVDQVSLKPSCSGTETKLTTETFACIKFSVYTFQNVNNKGADQTADVQVGLCLCYSHGIVRFFSCQGPNY